MEEKQFLENFYSNYDEDGRLASRHGSVEYLTTMRYIERYLRPGMKVLEIGAATGRYSHSLARMGYQVDALELVQHNIDIFRKNTQPGEQVTIRQGDARELPFEDECYDITLLLGPMYHLYTKVDQYRALSEAIRVTKKGGLIFAAYCGNEATLIQFCFRQGMILQEHYRNQIDPVIFKASSDPAELFELYRKEEIDELMTAFPTQRLHYVATDLATNYMRDEIDAMDDEIFELYLRYHFAVCERADLVGASHHILDIFRKE
jgi:ubiquinone/menaquinone biosynthesis C-methylase UbiE